MLTEQNRAWRIVLGMSGQNPPSFPFPYPLGLIGHMSRPLKAPTAGMTPGGSLSRAATPGQCPECGGRMVRIGYCFTCPVCGWGACG